MDKVKIHIPIDTDERMIIRDEVANSLSLSYDAVIIEFDNILLSSIIIVSLHEFTDDEYDFFKKLADLIGEKIDGVILLEVTKQLRYISKSKIMEEL